MKKNTRLFNYDEHFVEHIFYALCYTEIKVKFSFFSVKLKLNITYSMFLSFLGSRVFLQLSSEKWLAEK